MREVINAELSTPAPSAARVHPAGAHEAAATIPVPGRDVLTDILRSGAQRLLGQAIEAEVDEWVARHAELRNEHGHQLVVKNGHHPSRTIVTGVGAVEVAQPRVHDRRIVGRRKVEVAPGETVTEWHDADGKAVERFSSKVLPPYLRKAKAIDELIPWLYLKGISTGDFSEALQAILGVDAPGLSATTVARLMGSWQDEYKAWNGRDLRGKHYVYVWADGVHFNIRLEEDRQCILVLMGATAEGKKELIAVADGHRESEQSWRELLLGCRQRGMTIDPKLATADGALGFWKALPQVYPATREQRCWVHKTANVLDKMARRVQPGAKAKLHEIWMAPTREDAHKAFNQFVEVYGAKYPNAVECLRKDREVLLTFYDFPAAHWLHLRTTNPIESTFATVRLRHRRTKGNGSRAACLAMVFKLCQSAEKTWRLLNGAKLLPDVIAGVKFVNGEMTEKSAA